MWNHPLLPLVLLLGSTVLAGCHSGSPVAPEAPADAFELRILHLNDHHSTLAPHRKTLKFDLGNGTPDTVQVSAGGFPRVTQALQELTAAAPTPVLKLHAGDAMTGTLYFNRAGAAGEADAALMNTACFDAFALGNHEFDKGDTVLQGFLERLTTGGCRTQPLSANVHFGPQSALHASRAPDLVKPSVVIERQGERVGVIGLTIAAKTQASSNPDAGTTFEDEAIAAQREIDALTAQGVNKIVLLSHIGYGHDQQLIAKLRGVDVVVGGDSHSLLGPATLGNMGVGSPEGDYPTRLTDASGHPVCVVQAWQHAQIVGELRVTFDAQGVVTACAGTPHVLIGDDFQLASGELSAAQRQAIDTQVRQSGFLRVTPANPHATEVLHPFTEALAQFNHQHVGNAAQELCLRRMPGGPGASDFSSSSPSCNALGHVSLHGGDVQQLAVQAYLEVMRRSYGGADLSLQNAGAVRRALPAGPISAAQVLDMLSFANQVVRLTLTADEVKGMLEDSLDAVYGPRQSTGSYPYTGGLRFRVNRSAPKGERAQHIEWHDPRTEQWLPLQADRHYQLVTIDYLTQGRDGYITLGQVPPERRLNVGVLDTDLFFEYLASQPLGPNQLPLLQRLPTAIYSTQALLGP